MSKIQVQGPQGNVQEGQRLIIKLERYNEIGEILIENRTTGTHVQSGQRLEHICNYSGCLHGGERDRDANRAQGCTQSASKL